MQAVVVDRDHLTAALRAAVRVLGRSPSAQVTLQPRGRDLAIVARRAGLELVTLVECRENVDGDTLDVSLSELGAALKELPAGKVELSRAPGARLVVGAGARELNCAAVPPSPLGPRPISWALAPSEAASIARMLRAVLPAACRDPLPRALHGVRIESDGSTISMTASDGHRISARPIPSALRCSVMVPLLACQMMARMLHGHADVGVGISNTHLYLRRGRSTLCALTSTVERASYPSIEHALPTGECGVAVCDPRYLESKLRGSGPTTQLSLSEWGLRVDSDPVSVTHPPRDPLAGQAC